ncbi:MAG: lipase family protein, partial [Paludibacteraceae bacterium]|nr:lipase family protein [Paludibacteraceae bacterium]
GYPVAVPLVLQGMIKGNKLDIEMTDLMQEWLYNKMDDWVNSKLYSSSQINALIDTKVTHEILTQEAMDQTSDNVAELYKAMTANSIISYNWVPKAPVYIMHSIDDETVPYTNATNAKSRWKDANITYNFGHYGGHVMTCLRFIYSVQTLLQQEEEEMKQYE